MPGLGIGLGLTMNRPSGAGGGDVTAPTLTTATVDAAGTSLTLVFSESVDFGVGGNTGWTVTPTGDAATLAYASGAGTNTLVYTISRAITLSETLTTSYTQPGNGVEDGAGNDLASITNRATTNNSTQNAYAAAILSFSPYAYWKMDEAAPSGAGSILDSSGNARHITPPVSGVTWNRNGALFDGTSRSGSFDKTKKMDCGAAIADAIMGAAGWTIVLSAFVEHNATNETVAAGGTVFAAGSAANKRVSITQSGGTWSTSSTDGGNKSTSISVTKTWHHLVLTKAGAFYMDGTAQTGTTSATLFTTNQMSIGGRSDDTNWFQGRICHVAVFQTSLTAGNVTTLWNALTSRTLGTGLLFDWDMSDTNVDTAPGGADDISQLDQGATLTTVGGSAALSSAGSGFRSATFDNPTSKDVWLNFTSGEVRMEAYFTGLTTNAWMFFQITGKDRSFVNDKNTGILRLDVNSLTMVVGCGGQTVTYTADITLLESAWNTIRCLYDVAGIGGTSETVQLWVNGTKVASSTGALSFDGTLTACHQCLIGNDTSQNPTTFGIRSFKTYGSPQ